ncbi:MAG TPA: DNA translocase FtsK [Haploplasma sp.]|nr:DNA translocase FtsK [Haploplasma sp.]
MSELKKPITKSVHRPDFKIHQLLKLVGLRKEKIGEVWPPFVSPIYGTNVKDDIVIPKGGSPIGDNTKRFDTFRDKPLHNQDDLKLKNGTEYHEFNIISNQSRVDYLGGKIIEKSSQETNKPKTTKPVRPTVNEPIIASEPIYDRPTTYSTPGLTSSFVSNPAPKNINLEPVEKEEVIEQPKIEVFTQDSVIIKSDFGGVTHNSETEEPTKVKFEAPKKVVPIKNVNNNKKYVKPSINMFKKLPRDKETKPAWLLEQIEVINSTLIDFGIEAEVIGSTKGPTVTRYELSLKPGVNVSRISNLSDNLMMNLKAKALRIEAPIPGKPYVGLEVPNVTPEIVAFGNVIDDPKFLEAHDKPLQVALGVDIDGENVYVDIAKMPHGLIAGATNSGKSVCINTVLASLLIKNTPDELKLILIDPKMVELIAYNDLPHLITPVITDAKMAAQALKWAVDEMEKRYRLFANNRSRDIKSFNDNVNSGRIEEDLMPYLVIVIDELADLMMVAANDVEDSIQRLTQKARAAGIHLIVATQRPTTDVVKGTIKSNIPARIAFKVASFVDSTTILDGAGAEELLGKGDMLLKEVDRPYRLQGAYIPDEEIYDLTDYIRSISTPNYVLDHAELKNKAVTRQIQKDDYFNDVAYFVVENGAASINAITTEFGISFNRAKSIVEMLETYGIVSENLGTKAREVLVQSYDLEEILNGKDDN